MAWGGRPREGEAGLPGPEAIAAIAIQVSSIREAGREEDGKVDRHGLAAQCSRRRSGGSGGVGRGDPCVTSEAPHSSTRKDRRSAIVR